MVRNAKADPYADQQLWWDPIQLDSTDDTGPVLTEKQVQQWLEDGFLAVTGLWPEALIEAAAATAAELHPHEKVAEDKRGFSEMPWLSAPPKGFLEDPTRTEDAAPENPLNHMTVHPRAISVVAQLLDTPQTNVRLSQSHVIARWGGLVDPSAGEGDPMHGVIQGDQDIHVDYGNNTLLVPPRLPRPEAVACLCYYSSVEESGGATHFALPQPGELTSYDDESAPFNPPNFVAGTANGSAALPSAVRTKQYTEHLYATERPIRYRPVDAWHRGTPAALGKVRYSHHHVWRRADAEWVNWQSLAPRMSGMPNRYLEQLTVTQRACLGFPPPGNDYWTPETVKAVGLRYTKMDMSPYWKGLQGGEAGAKL